MNWSWVRRRFWDFRHGHSTYLAYALSFVNFIIITYTLLISNIPQLRNIFTHLWLYALFFLVCYPVLAVFIGYKEFRKKQYPTDVEVTVRQNPFLYKLLPGKEREIGYPNTILRTRTAMKIADKLGVLTPEDKAQFELLIEKLKRLVEGGTLK